MIKEIVKNVRPESIVEDYRKSGSTVYWALEPELQDIERRVAFTYRNEHAMKMAMQGIDEISQLYLNLTTGAVEDLINTVHHHVIGKPLQGIGMELGAGTGLVAATLCKSPKIEAILAVELCDKFAELIIPKVVSSILSEAFEKVVPVVGSFNNLLLNDNSIDFIIELGAFHHSESLVRTFNACYRVLKPGGLILCFDRCQPDTLTDGEVEEMLLQTYSEHFLTSHGFPPDIILSRRENGEHEYRFFEWERAFDEVGFEMERVVKFIRLDFRRAVKGVLSVLPRSITRHYYKTENADFSIFLCWVRDKLHLPLTRENGLKRLVAPKETTVFVLRKPH